LISQPDGELWSILEDGSRLSNLVGITLPTASATSATKSPQPAMSASRRSATFNRPRAMSVMGRELPKRPHRVHVRSCGLLAGSRQTAVGQHKSRLLGAHVGRPRSLLILPKADITPFGSVDRYGPKGDMRELRHLILHGLVLAFVRAMPYTLLSLLNAALPNQAR
jgi:hypothetical protein